MNFTVKKTQVVLLLIVLIGCLPSSVNAQKVIARSDNQKPFWLTGSTPKPTNTTFYYQVIKTEHNNLPEARASSFIQLSTYIKQTNHIDATVVGEMEKTLETEAEKYSFYYKVQGETLEITFEKKDEYWEYLSFPDGEKKYICSTLYAVSNTGKSARFDNLVFTNKYGMKGFARSFIVPGWGQIYKGSKAKGLCILGGEVVMAGGIILAENNRASYIKKMREQPRFASKYNSKADNWETIRNVTIGGAAAIYIYNLVDAIAANGTKRAIVKKQPHFTFELLNENNLNGVSLVYNF